VEHDADDETGENVRGKVMVEEELTRHGEEGEVVVEPGDQEETSSVVQSVTNSYDDEKRC
jgi:hypothetical protein